MYIPYNPSPIGARTGDCAVRAVAKALDVDWEEAYLRLCVVGYRLCDIPNANSVINALLHEYGFKKYVIPDTCPDCYTIGDFAEEHKEGTYILGTGAHVVAVVNGDIYDTWDSSHEIPIFYWR